MSRTSPARSVVQITVDPGHLILSALTGDTLLDALLDNGIDLEHECGGNCTCTTCHVYISEGGDNLTPVEEPEEYRLQFAEGRTEGSRLACQALLKSGKVSVRLPDTSGSL